MSNFSLIPAYGRDYQSKKAVITDLLADKDFIINALNGSYINLSEIKKQNTPIDILVRYGKLRKVCRITEKDLKHKE